MEPTSNNWVVKKKGGYIHVLESYFHEEDENGNVPDPEMIPIFFDSIDDAMTFKKEEAEKLAKQFEGEAVQVEFKLPFGTGWDGIHNKTRIEINTALYAKKGEQINAEKDFW